MLRLLVLIACSAWIATAGAQNVIINGDFETGPFDTNVAVSGWDVVGNVGSVSDQGFTTASHAAALSVGNNSEGDMLSQTFSTTIGQLYSLDFDSGVFGIRSDGALSLQIQVFGSGTLLDDTITPPYNGNFSPASFDHYTYTFTADSASTTLKFTDIGSGNANADIMLDTVSVVAAPEPATWMLMIVGLAPFGLLARRRRALQ